MQFVSIDQLLKSLIEYNDVYISRIDRYGLGSAPLSFNMRFYTTHRLQLSYITSKASAVDYKNYSMLIGTSRARLSFKY